MSPEAPVQHAYLVMSLNRLAMVDDDVGCRVGQDGW
jgi:hypothetical protein